MAKLKLLDNTKIIKDNIEEIMADRFGRYSKYIIQERALPDARDGLKPVQRRILYAMYHEGNLADKGYRKSAKTVGIVIGNYHPHGDTSVYEAMVRMSQSWKMNVPLVTMHGNNGSIDDDPAAAMRYTEARLAKVSQTMLEEIKEDTVSYAPNFDDTELEPTVLAAKFPLLLVNGATGIAAGYATNIPPHNFEEVINATIYRLTNPTCSDDDILDIIKGPDFPTSAIVQGEKEIQKALKTGRGRVLIKSKVDIIENKSINQIIVTEIPYETIKVNIVKKIIDLSLSKKIDGITEVRDESDRNGLKIVIDVKKDADAQNILNFLYKNTELQTYYNYNMVAIVNKRPQVLSVVELLDAFIEFRCEVVLKRSVYNYNLKEARCHILEGLIRAVSILDEIITLIRSSNNKSESKQKIIDAFDFSELQAEAIVTLQLYRLSNTDIKSLREEFAKLVNEMAELKAIIDSKSVLVNTIIKELRVLLNSFDYKRRTRIEKDVEEIVVDKLSMVSDEDFMVTISEDAYIKKVGLRSYNAVSNQMTGLKDNDKLVAYKEVNNKDYLVIILNSGKHVTMPVYELNEFKWKDLGSHLSSYMKVDPSEKVVSIFNIKSFDTCAYIVSATKSGYIKKTAIKDTEVNRSNKTYLLHKLKKGDELIYAQVFYQFEEVLMATKIGFALRYPIKQIPLTNAKG